MAFPLVFAPALPGRPRDGGARNARERSDAPLSGGPALAVAIPVSLAFHAKAPRRRREQEIRGSRARIGTTPHFDRGQDEIAPDPDVMRSSFRGFAH